MVRELNIFVILRQRTNFFKMASSFYESCELISRKFPRRARQLEAVIYNAILNYA